MTDTQTFGKKTFTRHVGSQPGLCAWSGTLEAGTHQGPPETTPRARATTVYPVPCLIVWFGDDYLRARQSPRPWRQRRLLAYPPGAGAGPRPPVLCAAHVAHTASVQMGSRGPCPPLAQGHTGRMKQSQDSDLGVAPGPVLSCVAWLPDYPVRGTKALAEAQGGPSDRMRRASVPR